MRDLSVAWSIFLYSRFYQSHKDIYTFHNVQVLELLNTLPEIWHVLVSPPKSAASLLEDLASTHPPWCIAAQTISAPCQNTWAMNQTANQMSDFIKQITTVDIFAKWKLGCIIQHDDVKRTVNYNYAHKKIRRL